MHICEMPIKCPVAPLEFAFLADSFFQEKGIREQVELTFVTPLSGAFTKPTATEKLGHLLQEKDIRIVSDFAIEKVDNDNKKICGLWRTRSRIRFVGHHPHQHG